MTREQILVAKISELCRTHDIPLLVCLQLDERTFKRPEREEFSATINLASDASAMLRAVALLMFSTLFAKMPAALRALSAQIETQLTPEERADRALALEREASVIATPRTRGEPIDLSRTELRLIADATRLLLQRTEATLADAEKRRARAAIEAEHGLSSSSISVLLRGSRWRIQPGLLARLEKALDLMPGDILSGKAPKPAPEDARGTRPRSRNIGAALLGAGGR